MDGTRERLLAAAKREFLEYGYRGASLRRIAASASVTTGAIYGCFGGKRNCLTQLWEMCTMPLWETLCLPKMLSKRFHRKSRLTTWV